MIPTTEIKVSMLNKARTIMNHALAFSSGSASDKIKVMTIRNMYKYAKIREKRPSS